MNKEARRKMVMCRTSLLMSNGFFGFLALQLNLVELKENDPIQTMAVDGRNLFYHPKFVMRITSRQCEGVICHEIMHCAFQHFSRRSNRNPYLWNLAGDFVINLDLINSGFALPGEPCSMDVLLDPQSKGKTGIYLFDTSLKGKSTEVVYDMLAKEITIIPIGIIDPGECGAVLDTPGSTSDKKKISKDWEVSVRVAVETARANNAGNIPESLQDLVRSFNAPKINWKEKTRRFIDQSLTKEVSWSRLSRRSVSIGTLMPGYIADKLRHLVFFVDTSGSISKKLAADMLNEIGGALDEGTADMVTVVYADTQVQHVDVYYQGDYVVAGHYAGGGTNFADSFRWLQENAPDASCVIYLTDLEDYGQKPEEPQCPVLWAVYNSDEQFAHLSENTPFGESIHISKELY